jgi:anaerobic ribonucleoside-triphosphate reductase
MKNLKSNNTNKLKVPVECYSRIVGYFRPINQWNKAKYQEYEERHEYHLEDIQKALIINKDSQCA